MKKKTCKKCSKELTDDSKYKLCEECQEKRKSVIKRILIGAGAISIAAATAILAGLAIIKREYGNYLGYDYDEDDDSYEDEFGEGIPVGCRTCGGDYPNCTTSCPMFDE